ncbi:MAG: HAMP domain-containing protein, partial [bacterium]|nr:HAMP domain-containing protein [bacterium]
MRIDLSVRLTLFAAVLIALTTAIVAVTTLTAGVDQFGEAIARGVAFSAIPGLLLALLFARHITASLSRISNVFRTVEQGDLDSRVASQRRDEIGDLARALDQMVARLDLEHRELANTQHKASLTAKALVTSERLAAVGQLAAGVAHEVNNPLTYVRSNLGQLRAHWSFVQKLLADRVLDDEAQLIVGEGEELIDESLEGVERAVSIVRDIKGFAHSGSETHESVELNMLLDSVLRVASPQLGPEVRIDRRYAASICVTGSGQELKQVFLNLILNASQAIGDTGTIRIETREEGNHAVVSVVDDGAGIDPEALEWLFDPFFTTKPVGQGTGLGLSISHEIIKRHGGEIHVESLPGEGSRFSVQLPLDA